MSGWELRVNSIGQLAKHIHSELLASWPEGELVVKSVVVVCYICHRDFSAFSDAVDHAIANPTHGMYIEIEEYEEDD